MALPDIVSALPLARMDVLVTAAIARRQTRSRNGIGRVPA